MNLIPNPSPIIITLLVLLVSGTGSGATILVPEGAVWQILDDGSSLGPEWTTLGFDDSTWSTGPAQLGFGEGDEATIVSYGPDSLDKYITTWLRHIFTVDDPGQFICLRLRLLRDDGAIVHLNGSEVLSSNMPAPPITPDTLAASTITGHAEEFFFEYYLDPEMLVAGDNVLAIEVHLRSQTSLDMSLDLELAGMTEIPHPIVEQPRLIPTGDHTSMRIAWQMAWILPATLQWGEDETLSLGTHQTEEYGERHEHSHVITGLQPDTLHHYQVIAGEDTLGGVFRTAPSAATSTLKFMVYGDTRTFPDAHNAVAAGMVETYNQDAEFRTMAITLGDIVGHGDMQDYWQSEFFDPTQTNIRTLVADLPYIACMGNHEESGALFTNYFPYPFVADRYWSFDYGPAHFSIVDQYVDESAWQTQMAWLDDDLASTDRPWKFVVLHEPGWSAGPNANNLNVQIDIQPLCLAHDVAMVLAGHNHYYARTVVDRIQHITTAGGGAPLYSPDLSYPYIVASRTAYHFCTVEIDGDHLIFSAQTPQGTVFDSFTLDRAVSAAELDEMSAPASGLEFIYPNPSNPSTMVAFELNIDHNVDLTICDLRGRHIRRLITGEQMGAGKHTRLWNGMDDAGSAVASGVYLVRLVVDGKQAGSPQKVSIVR